MPQKGLQVQIQADHSVPPNATVCGLTLFNHNVHNGAIDRSLQQEPYVSQWFFHRTRNPDRVSDHKAMSRSGVEGPFKHNFRLVAVETADNACNLV